MAMISAFTTVDRTTHNSRKFAFTLSPTNYCYWKTMIEPFLVTNNLMGYVDGSIPCPSKTVSVTDGATIPKKNPNYPVWLSNNAHVRMLIISTISEASFRHVQGTTSHDLWLSLEKAYAPHSTYTEYTLKTQLLRIEMHGDETPGAYLNRAQEYADALAVIGEPVKDKDLVMLVVSGLHEEYNGLKTTIIVRQSPTAFSELYALLSDHDYMLRKTQLTAQLSALGFQVSPIAPSGPQAFYGVRPLNNKNNNNNNCGNHNNSRVKYQQVVGSLQYFTLSRPDIAFAVNKMLTGLEIQMIDGPREAEYKALANIVAELTWLRALLNELGISLSLTPILWCDNLGATYLSANLIFHARTKHVEIDYHFVRKNVAQGDLRVQHISTHNQIADIFTKTLPTPRFLFLRSKLQVVARL
nr:hypothetical protein CTI12_AA517590 [Tanacetum cinerariifolium]